MRPAIRNTLFAKFQKLVLDIRELIGQNELKEIVLEIKALPGSNIDHLIRNISLHPAPYNLSGIIPLPNHPFRLISPPRKSQIVMSKNLEYNYGKSLSNSTPLSSNVAH